MAQLTEPVVLPRLAVTGAPTVAPLTGQPPRRAALRSMWIAFWTSRVLIFLCGVTASLKLGPPNYTFPSVGSLLAKQVTAWDGGWYLAIAQSGYGPDHQRMAFFPLYPALLHVLGWATTDDVTAGVLLSLACFAGALYLLHRLITLDWPEEIASTTVMLVAFCPMSVFFSALYAESLFLLLVVGAIYAMRQERWLVAGLLAALASATRSAGILLAIPMVVLFLYGPRSSADAREAPWRSRRQGWRLMLPRYAPSWRLWPVLLVPIGLLAFLAYLQLEYHAGTGPFRAQQVWGRVTVEPLKGIWWGVEDAWQGIDDLLRNPMTAYVGNGQSQPQVENLIYFSSFVVGVLALVGCFRTRAIPRAYCWYSLASVVIVLCNPVVGTPLMSLPRFEAVIFPMFIWAAIVAVRRNWVMPLIATNAVALGMFTTMFVTVHFIS